MTLQAASYTFYLMRVLAVDLGAKRIGLAVSDPLGISVRPLETLRRASADCDVAKLRSLVEELEVDAVVLGLPLRLDGSIGDAARKVIKYVDRLREHLSVPVFTQDERLTSYEAQQLMVERHVRPRDRRAQSDGLAATIILRDFLSTPQGQN